MNYKMVINLIAAENNTTPDEVDAEIRKAIKAAGYDIEPEMFIALSVAKVKGEMKKGG